MPLSELIVQQLVPAGLNRSDSRRLDAFNPVSYGSRSPLYTCEVSIAYTAVVKVNLTETENVE